MDTKKTILTVLAAALLAGCNDNDEPNRNEGKIDLRPGIEALTRSPHLGTDGSGTFADGDVFTLTVSAGGDYIKAMDYAMPSTMLYWEDLKLPGGTQEVSFAGCYPKHDGDLGSTFVFNVNHAEGEEKDLLLAPAVKVKAGSTAAVNLPFYHAMHKLVVKYKSDHYTDEALNAIQTTPRGAAKCLVDLVAGTVFGVTTPAQQNYAPQAGKEISVLLVPQAKELVSLQVLIDGKTLTYELSKLPDTTDKGQDITRLEGGKQLEVTLTVNKDGIAMDGIDIHGWETQGSVSGDIII